jgi:hypothetical protein
MANIEFSFICVKKFDDLEGKDPIQRHCLTCNKKVINLDALTEAEQQELSDISTRGFMELCVSATVQKRIEADPCPGDIAAEMYVGELRSPFAYGTPMPKEEVERRMAKIFSAARQRAQ